MAQMRLAAIEATRSGQVDQLSDKPAAWMTARGSRSGCAGRNWLNRWRKTWGCWHGADKKVAQPCILARKSSVGDMQICLYLQG